MKKTILILASLLMFAGIASASVESDTIQIRYQKCIQDLAKLDSVNYTKPDPNDPAFAAGNIGHLTYTGALASYNAQIAYREKKRNECKSLYGEAPKAVVQPQTTVVKSAAQSTETVLSTSTDDQTVDPIATHPVIMHIEKTINQFWILFGLIVFLLLVITWKVFKKEK